MSQNFTDKKLDIEGWSRELNARAIMFHHAVGERMGLSATEHKAADILRRFGPMTAGDLAERTGLTTGAVTGLVDRLERAGFVRREHDEQDRRRVIITPKDSGKFVEVGQLVKPLQERLRRLAGDYTTHDLAVIAEFASQVAEALKQEADRLHREARTRRGRE